MTAIIITAIICATILCIALVPFIVQQRQKKNSAKVLSENLTSIIDKK